MHSETWGKSNVAFVSKRYTQHGMDKYTMMQRDVNIDQIIYFKVNFKSMITVCITYENICNLGEQKLQKICFQSVLSNASSYHLRKLKSTYLLPR